MLLVLMHLLGLVLAAQGDGCRGWETPSSDGKRCYVLFDGQRTFNDAQTTCAKHWPNYVLTLASARSSSDNQLFAGIADGLFWTGGYYNDSTHSWQWKDGTPFNYSNWMAGHHNKGRKNMCVAADSNTGLWTPMQCDQKLSFVCGREITPTTTVAPPDCPAGAVCYKGFGYTMPPVQVFMWQEGENYCADMYTDGHLVSIHNSVEEAMVEFLFLDTDGEHNYAFLGGIIKDGEFTWSDGTSYDYQHFHPDYTESFVDGKCLEMLASDYRGTYSRSLVTGWGLVDCTGISETIICKFPLQ